MNRRSILLVTVDCLRAGHVGFMGYHRPTTPFLDSLAGDSFIFPAAMVAGAPTFYSFPPILSSQYPLAKGRAVVGLAPGEPSLASVLKVSGYATAAFAAANPYLSPRFGYDFGFDTFEGFLDSDLQPTGQATPSRSNGPWLRRVNQTLDKVAHRFAPSGALYDELYFQYCQRLATPRPKSMDILRRFPSAEILVDRARSWLATIGDAPFFLWLHFMDPHAPYYPHEIALRMVGEDVVGPLRARYLNSFWNRSDLSPRRLQRHRAEVVTLYDAGVRWVDAQVTRLIETLRNSNRWNNCIFAFTADHGEEFLDHGGRYHPPTRLSEELIHVPLLVRIPELPGRTLPDLPFSLLHLAPTLLDAADVAPPPQFQGRSHWSCLREGSRWEGIAIAEAVADCTNPLKVESRSGSRVLVIRENRYKLALSFEPFSESLYDLQADPHERTPLPPQAEKVIRRRLLEHAREHLETSHSHAETESGLKARLRDLRLEWSQPVLPRGQVAS